MVPASGNPPENLIEPLTPRETDILVRLAENKSNREIAESEILALSSVKWYVQQIYAKLGVNNRADAITRAHELGLLKKEDAAPGIPESPRHNLPRQLTRFIGRQVEVNHVLELVRASGLVTLTGSGGVGKTRLSLAAAEKLLSDFPDGTWFVELAALRDPDLVAQKAAGVLGIQEAPGKLILDSLQDFLRTKRVLLILDNCEHLVEACARLADFLLSACHALHILATSRELLGVAGEVPFRVPSLAIPGETDLPPLEMLVQYDAVRLFIERAQMASAGFFLSKDNAADILQICQRLDGIPLAIELAAARLRVLSAGQIALRLNDAFQLLTAGSRTALPHHQTLRALIDWSYNLLTEAEQSLLRQLAVFSGGWTLEAAEAVCCCRGYTLELLSSLVDKSLVLVDLGINNETRYHMLETVRQYARDKLWAVGDPDPLRRQHLDYFMKLAETVELELRGRNQKAALDRLEADLDNLRSALEWSFEADNQAELRLASALKWMWHIRGHRTEGIHWLEEGLSVEAQGRGAVTLSPDRFSLRAKATGATGCLHTMQRDVEKAAPWLEESLALSRQQGDDGKNGAAFALYWLGLGAYFRHDNPRANALGREGLELYRQTGDEFGQGECLKLIGESLIEKEPEKARPFLEESLALQEKIGDPDGTATVFYSLGVLAHWQKHREQGEAMYKKSLAYYRQVGNKNLVAEICVHLGEILLIKGDYQQALNYYEEARSYYQDIDTQDAQYFELNVLMGMGRAFWALGDFRQAVDIYEDAYAWRSKVNEVQFEMTIKALSGFAVISSGDWSRVNAEFKEVYRLSSKTQHKDILYFVLEGMGMVAAAQQQNLKAARLFGAAQDIQQEMMDSLTRAERDTIESSIKAVHAAISEEQFAAAAAEGHALVPEQVLAQEFGE